MYIPLGGNRVSTIRWVLNIFVVWALTGLWHGASWNFVIWGLYYGVLIVMERKTRITERIPKAISWILTFVIVSFGWAIFMSDNLSVAEMMRFLAKLFFVNGILINPVSIGSLRLRGYIPFLVIVFFLSTPLWVSVLRAKLSGLINRYEPICGWVKDAYLILVLILSLGFLIGGTYNPFIYFRF